MFALTLTFTAPTPPISVNATGRDYQKGYRLTHPWRDITRALAHNQVIKMKLQQKAWSPVPINVHVTLPFRTTRTRDPHNYVGTNVKRVVDGLVKAGLVPDDNPEWVTVLEPTLAVLKGAQTVAVTITERITP